MPLRPKPARDADWFDYATETDALLRRVDATAGSLVGSSSISSIVTLTQAQYDALSTKSPTILYVITGN